MSQSKDSKRKVEETKKPEVGRERDADTLALTCDDGRAIQAGTSRRRIGRAPWQSGDHAQF